MSIIQNFIQLIFSTALGIITTGLNIQFTTQLVNVHLAMLTAAFGLVTAIFTCVYLYWQIKKIKGEFKNMKFLKKQKK